MMRARIGLLLAAFIWGFSFVIQRVATSSIGPFGYNFVRFALAAIVLFPLSYFIYETKPTIKPKISIWLAGGLCGIFMFVGAALQQTGLAYTTASKAAFITALYIVIVPILGLFLEQALSFLAIVGVALTVYGTILLTAITTATEINFGDGLILISALCWALQIIAMGFFAPRFPCIKVTAIQFLIASLLNGIATLFFETLTISQISDTLFAILYGGIMTAGVGFTLQTIFQQKLAPTETSLILSTEMVFASLMGWLFLNETFSTPEFIGVVFISIGVILAEIPISQKYSILPFFYKKES